MTVTAFSIIIQIVHCVCVCVRVLEHPCHLDGPTYPHVSVVEVQETNKGCDAHSVQQQPGHKLQRLRKIVFDH